ncbi:MAG: hypothetical protein LC098_04175 [Burkholderiales bacterium]|nr:hypothetical protein [Burkholderiales bacterium]
MPEPRQADNSYASPLPTGAWLGLIAFLILVMFGQWWSLHSANIRIEQQDTKLATYDELQKKVAEFASDKQKPDSLCAMAADTQKKQLELLHQCNDVAGKATAAAQTFRDQLVQCEQSKR